MWGRPAPPIGRPDPGAHCQPPHHNDSSPPPPRMHLRRPLSWFDPRAHIGRSSLYIPAPVPPERHMSFEKIETLIILRAPPYSRAYLVWLGLEGGKQSSLGFLIVLRAWFGIIIVALSLLYLSLLLYVCYNCDDIIIHIVYVPSCHVHCLL